MLSWVPAASALTIGDGVHIGDGDANEFVTTTNGNVSLAVLTFDAGTGAPVFDGTLLHFVPATGTSSWDITSYTGTTITLHNATSAAGTWTVSAPGGILHITAVGLDVTTPDRDWSFTTTGGNQTVTIELLPAPPHPAIRLNHDASDSAAPLVAFIVGTALCGFAITTLVRLKERN